MGGGGRNVRIYTPAIPGPAHGFNRAAGLAPPQLMQTQISTGDLRSRALGTLCSVLGAMITVFCCLSSVRYVCCLVSNLIIQHPSESVSSVPVSPLFSALPSIRTQLRGESFVPDMFQHAKKTWYFVKRRTKLG